MGRRGRVTIPVARAALLTVKACDAPTGPEAVYLEAFGGRR